MGTKGPQLERKFPLAAAAAPHLRCLFLSNLLTKGPPATTSQSQAAMVEKSLGVPANLVKIFPWCKIMTTFSNLTKFGNSSRRLQDYKFPAVSSSQPLFRCNVLRNMFCRYRCETASLIMLRMKGTGIYSPLARTKAKAARARETVNPFFVSLDSGNFCFAPKKQKSLSLSHATSLLCSWGGSPNLV